MNPLHRRILHIRAKSDGGITVFVGGSVAMWPKVYGAKPVVLRC